MNKFLHFLFKLGLVDPHRLLTWVWSTPKQAIPLIYTDPIMIRAAQFVVCFATLESLGDEAEDFKVLDTAFLLRGALHFGPEKTVRLSCVHADS